MRIDLNRIYTKKEKEKILEKVEIDPFEVKDGDIFYVFMYRCRTSCTYERSVNDGWVIVRAVVHDTGWCKKLLCLEEDRIRWENTMPREHNKRRVLTDFPHGWDAEHLSRVYYTVIAKEGDPNVKIKN